MDRMTLHEDIESVLFTESEIEAVIDRLAADVTNLYSGVEFTVVSILKGSCIFTSDLIRRIPIPLEWTFVGASSYRSGMESGELEVRFLPEGREIEGRELLLVDDILDTGRTLVHVRDDLLRRGARQVRTCVLLDKPARRVVPVTPDLRGFEVDDRFVVGYGLDLAGRYRNLPYVGGLRADVLERLSRAVSRGS